MNHQTAKERGGYYILRNDFVKYTLVEEKCYLARYNGELAALFFFDK